MTASFGLRRDAQQVATLDLNLPTAFADPCIIDIEAYWHQPNFSQVFWQKIRVTPLAMDIPGLSWQITGPKIKQQGEKLQSESLNSLLSVRANEVLAAHHINALVSFLSLEWAKEFDLIAEGYLGAVPSAEPNQFALRLRLSNEDRALAQLFLAYLQRLVRIWFVPQTIKLTLELVG